MTIELYLIFLLRLLGLDTMASVTSLPPLQKSVLIEELVSGPSGIFSGVTKPVPPLRVEPISPAPRISSSAGIVVDGESGKILWAKEPDTVRPIASLTKLMTTSVVAGWQPAFDDWVELTGDDNAGRIGGWLEVPRGDRVTVHDLFAASLIGSMNNAARGLARSTGLSTEEFVSEMNATAQKLGMMQTVFVDPTGLDPQNKSTPQDLVRLVRYAFSFSIIRELSVLPEYDVVTKQSRRLRVSTTNALLEDSPLVFRGAKTGYLDEAGYTFAAYVEQEGKQVIVVLMGSPTSPARFEDAESLAEWAFRTYTWFSFFTSPPR